MNNISITGINLNQQPGAQIKAELQTVPSSVSENKDGFSQSGAEKDLSEINKTMREIKDIVAQTYSKPAQVSEHHASPVEQAPQNSALPEDERRKLELEAIKPGLDLAMPAVGSAAVSIGLGFLSRTVTSPGGKMIIEIENSLGHEMGSVSRLGSALGTGFSGAAANLAPFTAGLASAFNLYRGGKEIIYGLETKDKGMILNGALDVGLAFTSAISIMPVTAGIGLVGSAIFLGARFVSSMVQNSMNANK